MPRSTSHIIHQLQLTVAIPQLEAMIVSRSCGRSTTRLGGKGSPYMRKRKEEQDHLIMIFTGCLERVQMGMLTTSALKGWRDSMHLYPGEDQQTLQTT
jgi:hypothetical protein